jgi:hypothetical protein
MDIKGFLNMGIPIYFIFTGLGVYYFITLVIKSIKGLLFYFGNKDRKIIKKELNKIIMDFDNLFDETKNIEKTVPCFHCFDDKNQLLFGCTLSERDIYYVLDILNKRTLEEDRISRYRKILDYKITNAIIRSNNETN